MLEARDCQAQGVLLYADKTQTHVTNPEHLPCARHYSRCRRVQQEQNKLQSLSPRHLHSVLNSVRCYLKNNNNKARKGTEFWDVVMFERMIGEGDKWVKEVKEWAMWYLGIRVFQAEKTTSEKEHAFFSDVQGTEKRQCDRSVARGRKYNSIWS